MVVVAVVVLSVFSCLACQNLVWIVRSGSFSEQMEEDNQSVNYTVSQKKGATLTMAITLSILDRFAKFFHYCKDQ